MRHLSRGSVAIFAAAVVAATVLSAVPCRADDVPKPVGVEQARAAALRGLAFTEKDAAAWRATSKRAPCHQGILPPGPSRKPGSAVIRCVPNPCRQRLRGAGSASR